MRSVSIMPIVDGQRAPDYLHMRDVSDELPDHEVGEAIGDCLRNLQTGGVFVGDNQVELSVKLF